MTRFTSLKLIVVLLSLCAAGSAESKWRHLQSGKWALYTDAGESGGASILRQMLEMQTVFGQVALKLPEAAPPIRVVIYRGEQDFKLFRRQMSTRGVFQSGQERDYILLLQTGDETARAARHEYVHLVLHHTSGPMPAWLEEGLAEYFSTLRQRGGKVVVGEPIAAHQHLLGESNWLKTNEFMSLRTDSPAMAEAGLAPRFYAQSWALTHVLMRAREGAGQVRRFSELLNNGLEQSIAFQQAFGRKMDEALGEAALALGEKRFPAVEVPLPVLPELAAFQSREMSEVESRVVRAEVLLAAGRQVEGEKVVRDSLRQWPGEPALVASMGYLAMRQADYGQARRYLEQAVALGDRQASTYFELAMLTRDTGGAEELVVERLKRAVELNPSFAEAWYLLGASRLRSGRAGEAVESLRTATQILPRQSLLWEALGRAYQAAGQREAARFAAQRAVTSGTTAEQIAMAQGLLREIDTVPAPAGPARPGVVVPKTWEQKKGDSVVSGKLVQVDCGGTVLKFHIQPAGVKAAKVILATDAPNEIMLSGKTGKKREFVCGVQAEAPLVEAGYIAAVVAVAAAPAVVEAAPKAAPKAAPAKGRRAAAPVARKPADPPVAGELVTLEFK